MRICVKCHAEKDEVEFYKQSNTKDGLQRYCKLCSKDHKHLWYQNNKEKELDNIRAYQLLNKEHIAKKHYEYVRLRKKNDINFKLAYIVRGRLNKVIHKTKDHSAIDSLGCSVSELKQHLESKFQFNMTWANYGFYGWHIDHIKPLSSFDLSDPEQFKQACHYTNLQPLWATDNLRKGNR